MNKQEKHVQGGWDDVKVRKKMVIDLEEVNGENSQVGNPINNTYMEEV